MARVKRGNKRKEKRKKILKLAKGYWGTKSKAYRIAKQQVDRSLAYAYRDRRQKKRHFRSLWIVRINAAARLHGLSYNRLIHGLKLAGLGLDRKVLADMAVRDADGFGAVAALARQAIEDAQGSQGKVEKKDAKAEKKDAPKKAAKKDDDAKAEAADASDASESSDDDGE